MASHSRLRRRVIAAMTLTLAIAAEQPRWAQAIKESGAKVD
ncbi:MAG TPA: hypothetical protein VFO33_04215 [Casimicrobiaceae bacterium]|nr:hypothetical protein [Casimicrobiaceae bacterium]